jgi:tripartite ATP-independent transporter DctP family solute receptor
MRFFKSKLNRSVIAGLTILSMLTLAGCGTATTNGSGTGAKGSSKPVEIKFATAGPEDHPYTIGSMKFKELVEAKSGGQIKVTLFPNGQLGGELQMAEAVKAGTIQMTAGTSDGPMPAFVKDMQVFSVPYLFRDDAHVWKVLDGEIGQQLNKQMEAAGFKELGFWALGWRNFTNSKREIKSASDLKGLKIRVQESKVWIALTDALGAFAQPIAFNELYTALQQGVVDGEENPPASIKSTKLYEVQKYMTLDRHTFAPGSILMNLSFFNNLTPQQQQWVQEAVKESEPYQRQKIAATEKSDIEFLKTKMNVTEPDSQSFVDATKDIPNKISDLVSSDLINKVKAVK